MEHPGLDESVRIALPASPTRLGEASCAYVILRLGAALAPQELIEWWRLRCTNFKALRFVKVVAEFESIGMTGSSKVQKAKLREHTLREFGLG